MFCNKRSSTSVGCRNFAVLLALSSLSHFPLPTFTNKTSPVCRDICRDIKMQTEMHRISYVRIHIPSWVMMTQALVPLLSLTSQKSVHQDIAVTPDCLKYHLTLSTDKQELFKWQLLWLNT